MPATETPQEATPTAVAEAAATQPAAGEAAPAPEAEASAGGLRVFRIVPDRSEARFTIDETLLGAPKTVVGSTSLVEGEVTVDLGDYSVTEIGPIQIDARSLTTDDDFRNRALRRQVLQSQEDAYQFILFAPTGIEGLPETATVGEAFEFSVTGDLKIREITQPVTFAVTVTPVSEQELQGIGVATVQRADFDLRIPNVPGVANVSEEVLLEIEFVATAE
jgi:polyisoprenoid-binding protein YceI